MCGNDRAKIDCAKSFEDIDFECFSEKDNDNDIEGPSTEKVVQVTKASQVKASRKRKRSFEVQDVVGDISIKFGEVTLAIGRMVNSRLDVTKLYEEVMAMKGYEEEFLGDVFDYFVQSDILAKAFMHCRVTVDGQVHGLSLGPSMKLSWQLATEYHLFGTHTTLLQPADHCTGGALCQKSSWRVVVRQRVLLGDALCQKSSWRVVVRRHIPLGDNGST
ncbi:hypothetical protein BC332_02267 [Capsicum chinense]|nr:hypothetical protein BC332_02267 [Capsicum chinense]